MNNLFHLFAMLWIKHNSTQHIARAVSSITKRDTHTTRRSSENFCFISIYFIFKILKCSRSRKINYEKVQIAIQITVTYHCISLNGLLKRNMLFVSYRTLQLNHYEIILLILAISFVLFTSSL